MAVVATLFAGDLTRDVVGFVLRQFAAVAALDVRGVTVLGHDGFTHGFGFAGVDDDSCPPHDVVSI